MFVVTNSTGFHIKFPNGVTLSTRFGNGNYCSNFNKHMDVRAYARLQSKDAEIGIWDIDGKELIKQAYKETFGEVLEEDVEGYVTLSEWLGIMDWCRAYKSEEKKEETKGNV